MIPRRFLWLFDLVTLCLAFATAYVVVPYVSVFFQSTTVFSDWASILSLPAEHSGQLPPYSDSLWILLVMSLSVLLVIGLSENPASLLRLSLTRLIVTPLMAVLGGLGTIALVMFAFKSAGWSRLLILVFSTLGAIGLVTYRLVLRKYLRARRRAGYYNKNVLLIGLPDSVSWMIQYLASIPGAEYRAFGYLSVYDDEPDSERAAAPNLTLLGSVKELGELLIHQPIHDVIAIQPMSGGLWIQQVVQDCDYFAIPLRIVPEALLLKEPKSLKMLYHMEPLHLPCVVLAPRLTGDSEALFFKRLFDIIVSGMLLVLASPLLLAIAIAIKLTTPKLSVFYPWRVVGRNGVEFIGYKFTTMNPDADEVKSQLAHRNEMTGPVFKMKNDPRVTPLGRILRKYSLNELPQLWSVLKGDMSLVGPRPAFRHELERYEFWHKRKLSIQPGITCLWQVNGRNRISNFDDWVNMDLEYIDNWSLWLDIKILIRTAKTVIAGTGW